MRALNRYAIKRGFFAFLCAHNVETTKRPTTGALFSKIVKPDLHIMLLYAHYPKRFALYHIILH